MSLLIYKGFYGNHIFIYIFYTNMKSQLKIDIIENNQWSKNINDIKRCGNMIYIIYIDIIYLVSLCNNYTMCFILCTPFLNTVMSTRTFFSNLEQRSIKREISLVTSRISNISNVGIKHRPCYMFLDIVILCCCSYFCGEILWFTLFFFNKQLRFAPALKVA